MSFFSYQWRPTRSSVEKKNTKYALASAIISIWHATTDANQTEAEMKGRIQAILTTVL